MKRGIRLSGAMVLSEKNRKHGVVWRRRLSGAMVLSATKKEREKSEEREVDEEVRIFMSEKEREEDEEVGRKEKDWVSRIQRWDEKREILFSFWFIFWSSKIMKIMRVWHANLFTFCSNKYLNCSSSEIVFYSKTCHLLVSNCIKIRFDTIRTIGTHRGADIYFMKRKSYMVFARSKMVGAKEADLGSF